MIEIRELHRLEEFAEAFRLFTGIWGFEPGNQPVNPEMMRALSHAGNYVAGAYDGGVMVGASVAFFAEGAALHSHITGALVGRGIGFALKRHQRAWALDRGLERVTWTYDPLVRRNAHFNLAKLGARPEEYLPGFYGAMDDAVNKGDESDRLLAVWRLAAPAGPYTVEGARVALRAVTGRPVTGDLDAKVLLVAVPEDVEALRKEDPGAAKAWRYAVRDVLGGLLDDGARVTGFHAKTYYVVERP
ncbi:GNAT family N-acetyltransferase [Nonomuraea africana]|uniref:GNAT superfamily acetyltransferase n=1 Tax=Nonomuraea africana TaxID=46171 RepID=A0ABR9KC00_9ACTN|nr:GNAT family N-acetyltransferase [Nonomuraea africana]MBE1559531.1 putative GNAT superfamily acetyltransferase [Nonomuraea africana]